MNAQTQWQIFVGLNDGDTNLPLSAARVEKAVSRAVDDLSGVFGGCEISSGIGAWGAVREDTVILTVITNLPNDEARESIRVAAIVLQNRLNQQAILITKTALEVEVLAR